MKCKTCGKYIAGSPLCVSADYCNFKEHLCEECIRQQEAQTVSTAKIKAAWDAAELNAIRNVVQELRSLGLNYFQVGDLFCTHAGITEQEFEDTMQTL